jgi:phosphoglycolate phosphatase-like HAD superfamily hydrolase
MSSLLPFRTFLFDLDGTLIDHFAAIGRTYAHTLARFGRPPPSRAEVRNAVGGGSENSIAKFFTAEELPEATRVYRAYWDRTMLDDVVLMPGARELLASLHQRGAVMAVITNKLGSSSRLICTHLGLDPFLSAVIGAKDTPWLKPDRAFTLHVLGLLKAEPASTLLVGDSPYDIEAAHVAHLPAWCVSTGTHDAAQLRAAGVDRVFDSLAEVGIALLRTPKSS